MLKEEKNTDNILFLKIHVLWMIKLVVYGSLNGHSSNWTIQISVGRRQKTHEIPELNEIWLLMTPKRREICYWGHPLKVKIQSCK